MPTIELRTTTAFLFFLASAGILYASTIEPDLRRFAYSAFCFFTMLGPLGWIERSLVTSPVSETRYNGLIPITDLISEANVRRIRKGLLGGQLVMLLAGVGYSAVVFV